MESQKTLNSQSHSEKKEQRQKHNSPVFTLYYKSTNQHGIGTKIDIQINGTESHTYSQLIFDRKQKCTTEKR